MVQKTREPAQIGVGPADGVPTVVMPPHQGDTTVGQQDSQTASRTASLLSGERVAVPGGGPEGQRPEIAFRPSFYVMVLVRRGLDEVSREVARSRIDQSFFEYDERSQFESKVAVYRRFRVAEMRELSWQSIEIQFTWDRVHWYWSSDDVSRAHVYELQFGVAIMDFGSRKGIIACHNQHERKVISRAIGKALDVTVSPLVLTKPVLDQIGRFEYVKRAGYFVSAPDVNTPSNITYADDNLASKSVARTEEEHPRSSRKHSFYRVPLGSIEEVGVGATSDSGKLWIPREVPLASVRGYAIELLKRIGGTLGSMTRRGEYSEVIRSLGLGQLECVQEVVPLLLRDAVCELLDNLANMVLKRETERPFRVTQILATKGVSSKLFDFPRLEVVDPETGDSGWWTNPDGSGQLLTVRVVGQCPVLRRHPGGEDLDLRRLRHPVTGVDVEVTDPLGSLELRPTVRLHEIAVNVMQFVSHQISGLERVHSLPFQIRSGMLRLDVNRALGNAGLGMLECELHATDMLEMRRVVSRSVGDSEALGRRLRKLGEQCKNMSDENCAACLENRQYLCIRSLVARYLRSPVLLSHKCIELHDLEGLATVGATRLRVWGFAKQARRGSLTLRNTGASLLAQVVGQVDKATFDGFDPNEMYAASRSRRGQPGAM